MPGAPALPATLGFGLSCVLLLYNMKHKSALRNAEQPDKYKDDNENQREWRIRVQGQKKVYKNVVVLF